MKEKEFKYYNENYFRYIQNLVRQNRLEIAVLEYEKYLSSYPEDCCCYSYYADALIKLGRFEQAEEVLNSIVVNSKTPELSKQDIVLMNLKLLSCRQRYDECLAFVRENFDIFDSRNWNVIELLLFFKKKLGLLMEVNYEGYSYKVDQITNYSEAAAIDCIKKCHRMSENNPPAYFFDDFQIEEIYYKIRNMLPLENKIYNDAIENFYIFQYDKCGKVEGKVVNYIKVVTLHESNDIITMFPYENKERMDCINLTPLSEDYSKVKRMSQIEKFNQKYHR